LELIVRLNDCPIDKNQIDDFANRLKLEPTT